MGLFIDTFELIYSYTRAQALDDGVLVDVTDIAKEAEILIPVAVTAKVWADVESLPARYAGSNYGPHTRIWDVLWMCACAMRRAPLDASEVRFTVIMPVGRKTHYYLKAVIGPGDDGEPVLTIMRPDED